MNKEIYLAGGCFWGVEHYFSLIDGITQTSVGYANGDGETNYKILKTTDHAETVKITYDDSKISLNEILDLYYQIVDPLSLNKQGNDIGRQYRTGIYYTDENDLDVIKASLANLEESLNNNSVIEVSPLINYILAEDYHQDYLVKNPNGYCHIGKKHFEDAKNYKK